MILEKGTKVVCIADLLDFTIGEIYTIHTVDLDRECFMLIDDIEENNILDLENFDLYFKVKTKKDKIVKQVTDKFKARSKVGIEKYGTTLEENNTDDFLTHLEEEMMDSLLYIQKLKSQKDYSLQAKHNELIQQFDKLKKEHLEYFSEVELINHLGKKGYSITIKREL